jgi:hypothetical protein
VPPHQLYLVLALRRLLLLLPLLRTQRLLLLSTLGLHLLLLLAAYCCRPNLHEAVRRCRWSHLRVLLGLLLPPHTMAGWRALCCCCWRWCWCRCLASRSLQCCQKASTRVLPMVGRPQLCGHHACCCCTGCCLAARAHLPLMGLSGTGQLLVCEVPCFSH